MIDGWGSYKGGVDTRGGGGRDDDGIDVIGGDKDIYFEVGDIYDTIRGVDVRV